MKHFLLIVALACGAAPFARAQDDNPFRPPQFGNEDPRQRMIELFQKVETRLSEIDALLYRAGSGEAPLKGAKESGIAELLQKSRTSGDQVLNDIDEILKLAEQMGGQSQGQGGQQPKGGKPQPQPGGPQQGSQRPQSQERTPDAPGQEPQGQDPQQQGQGEKDKPENQPDPKDGTPNSPKESKAPGENSAGKEPPGSNKGDASGARGNEQWAISAAGARPVPHRRRRRHAGAVPRLDRAYCRR
jgi:hypothetical protein